MTDYARLHGWVSGVVQGVGFMFFVQDKAEEYKLTGWVRNMPDGRVEFVAEGPKGLLGEFLRDMKVGPRAAHVSSVNAEWGKYTSEFKGFRIAF